MFKNFYCCNSAVSDFYDGKSKNKIDVVFFSKFPWLHVQSQQQQKKSPLEQLVKYILS